MSRDIEIDTVIRVKQGIFWKGTDISGRMGIVMDNFSYIFAKIDGFEEPVKLMRHEIHFKKEAPEPVDLNIFDFLS